MAAEPMAAWRGFVDGAERAPSPRSPGWPPTVAYVGGGLGFVCVMCTEGFKVLLLKWWWPQRLVAVPKAAICSSVRRVSLALEAGGESELRPDGAAEWTDGIIVIGMKADYGLLRKFRA
ncbi:hypothetical protein Dimus_010957 [Dionaea muscipula]